MALRAELSRLEGADEAHLAALQRLWSAQGEVQILQLCLQTPSIEALVKRRLEFRLSTSTSQITLDKQ